MEKKYREVTFEECRMRSRYCFSIRYLQSAYFFCKQGYDIEKTFLETNNLTQEIRNHHFAYVSNALLSSVSFLEATINELFANASEYPPEWNVITQDQNKKIIELFQKMWALDIPRTAHYPIVKKYEIALALAGKTTFDTGMPPYQNTKSVIQLRNYLMHYEPEWIEVQPGIGNIANEHKLKKILKGKFSENPLAYKTEPFSRKNVLDMDVLNGRLKIVLHSPTNFFKTLRYRLLTNHLKKKLLQDSLAQTPHDCPVFAALHK